MLRAMLRKTIEILAWIVGGLAGLVVAIYVAALAVNWRDQPPSPEAVKLAASYETRPALADDANAFIYLLGFDAALGDDPPAVGARRLAWLRSTNDVSFDSADDPQTTHLEPLSTDPVVAQFLMVCGEDTRDCAVAFTDSGSVFRAWNATHPWLLERYLALIAHSAWREEVFFPSAPFPGYAPALHGQRLLLLQAKVLADAGDTRAASELLASDARFWRMVLAESDLLITKMIATAALRRHFEWGSLTMRSFPSESVATQVSDEWRRPMTDLELSLHRTLVGEWIFFSNVLARPPDFGALGRPFFQRQATLNEYASYVTRLDETIDAPLLGYAGVADEASELTQQTARDASPPRSLYNIAGTLLIASSPPDYVPYAARVADIEGMRRGALAVVLMRENATPQPDETLTARPLLNPYDDQPLRWDAEEQAVVFVGLEPGERGEHRFYY
jgi:hypothetical protein